MTISAFLATILALSSSEPSVCPPTALCIALGVWSEARGESVAGQLAVANVVLQRGRDACSVIQEPGQFDGVARMPYPREPWKSDPEGWGYALGVAHSAMRGNNGPCPSASHFHSGPPPYWATGKACVVGLHSFYTL